MLLTFPLAHATPGFDDVGFVLTAPADGPFAGGVGAPTVDHVGGIYSLYFESPSTEVPAGCANSWHVGRATSTDGVTWTLDAEPVLRPDEANPTSARHCVVNQPAAVHDGTNWHFFTLTSDGVHTSISWATSSDGTTVTWRAEPLIPPSDGGLGLASAVVVDEVLLLIYVDYPDLRLSRYDVVLDTWTSPTDPVLSPGDVGAWAEVWLLGPSVTCDPSGEATLAMVFGGDASGGARSLGLARSDDGEHWTIDAGSPLASGTLDYGALNHWDVLGQGSGYRMWYSKTDPATGLKAIGFARTDDAAGEVAPRRCAGPPPEDTGTPPEDTNPPAEDTGTSAKDTGTPGGEGAGANGSDGDASGCGCMSPVGAAPSALLAGLAIVSAIRRRR